MSDEPSQAGSGDAEVDLASLPKCPACGYIVYKLTVSRCPECGAAFRWEDTWPCQLALVQQARNERRQAIAGGACLVLGIGLTVGAAWRGDWSLIVCLASPLVGTTLAEFMRRLYLGEPLHGPLLLFGVLWLLYGALLWMVRL
jgi:hypothetical protein